MLHLPEPFALQADGLLQQIIEREDFVSLDFLPVSQPHTYGMVSRILLYVYHPPTGGTSRMCGMGV
jgi:hypothetical protein